MELKPLCISMITAPSTQQQLAQWSEEFQRLNKAINRHSSHAGNLNTVANTLGQVFLVNYPVLVGQNDESIKDD
jgi:hypothetical protein